MISRITLMKFAEEIMARTSSSSTSGYGNGNSYSRDRDGNSVNNTLSKARNNHDVQPLERDHHDLSPKKMPSYNMNYRKVNKTSTMSKLEDRRILNRPRGIQPKI